MPLYLGLQVGGVRNAGLQLPIKGLTALSMAYMGLTGKNNWTQQILRALLNATNGHRLWNEQIISREEL